MSDDDLAAARLALAECDAVVDRLHKMCCEPDRSPRMLEIKALIGSVGAELDATSLDGDTSERLLSSIMDIGGQIGHLQVGCCAPARMPLYADALSSLTDVQLSINQSVGRGH